MCSNNDSSACGGGGDDGGGASLRKNKRPRVPKRGPGVAELERILSEQHQSNRDVQLSDHMMKLKGSTNQCLVPSGFQQFSQNSVPFGPDDQFQPHFSNGSGNAGKGGSFNGSNANNACGGSHSSRAFRVGGSGSGSGSGVVLPEKTLIPANWGSGDHQSGRRGPQGFAFPPQMANGPDQSHQCPTLSKKPCQFQPSTINLFIPHRFPALSGQFSAGMYNHLHVEPPSNQRVAHSCTSTWPKEDQASSFKRHWPFTEANNPVPPSVTSQPPRWPPGIHMLGSSSSATGNNVILDPGTPSSPFTPPRIEKSVIDSEAPNFRSSCQQGFSEANPFHVQEFNGGYEESYGQLATDELIPQRPCYSFLEQKTSSAENKTIGLLNERTETRDVIDLNLKL